MRKNNLGKNIIDIICQACMFVLIQYMLACFYFSFMTHILSIVLMIGNASVIMYFWRELSLIIDNKIIKCAIVFASIIAVGFILIICGYFPVSTTLREVLL